MSEINEQAVVTAEELNEIIKVRHEKLAALKAEGNDPFIKTKFDFTALSTDIKENFAEFEGKTVRIAGRIMSRRIMGKASFAGIQDTAGKIQFYIRRDDVGEDVYAAFKKWDIGDIVGLEGFVFFVNENNPVNDLTSEQIRKIYSCEYTNWKELGGADRIINPVTRLEGSGSQTAFEAFMGKYKIGRKSPFAITGASVGFSFRYYMDGIVENENVKMLSLDGVYPSRENIQNRTYTLVSQFYAIYRKDNKNENIPVLIDWLLSEEGQTLIEKTGYVRIK